MPLRTTEQKPPLARLVDDAMNEHRLSLRGFADRAVDPETGYRVSHHTVQRIRAGRRFRLTSQLIQALKAATGKPLEEVQLAATEQLLSLEVGGPTA